MKRKRKEKKRLKKYQNKNKISFGDDEEAEDVAPKVKYYQLLMISQNRFFSEKKIGKRFNSGHFFLTR